MQSFPHPNPTELLHFFSLYSQRSHFPFRHIPSNAFPPINVARSIFISQQDIQDEPSHVPNFPDVANQPPADQDDSYGVSVNRPLKRRRDDEGDKGGERASQGLGERGGGGSVGETLISLILPDEEEKRERESFFIESLQSKASLESSSIQGIRAIADPRIQAHKDDANEIEMRKNKRVGQSGAAAAAATAGVEGGDTLALFPLHPGVEDHPRDSGEWCNGARLPGEDLWRKFRMSDATFDFICSELYPAVTYTMLREEIPFRQRVALCLYWLATGEPDPLVLARFGISILTCHKIVLKVCSMIRDILLPKFLKWPDESQLAVIKDEFEAASGIPRVCGAMYTTHVPITDLKISIAAYLNSRHTERNQKTSSSLTIQGVVDPRGVFTDVCIGWPGSMSDEQVLEKSALHQRASAGQLKDGWVVGNHGHPLMDWVLVPYMAPYLSSTQLAFNGKLAAVQGVAREAFARLMGRWLLLQKWTEFNLEDLLAVVEACCVLHNICEERNNLMDPTLRFHILDDVKMPENPIRSATAAQARDHIANNLLPHGFAGTSFL